MTPGKDYVVRGDGCDSWVAFPDVPGMETTRHRWVLVRNERPRNPSFHGAPQPKHRHGEEDRNGLILMAYFRPFTLQESDVGGVCRVSDWCADGRAMGVVAREWLDGGLTCEEAKRYVQNYMSVVDMRPEGEESSGRNFYSLRC